MWLWCCTRGVIAFVGASLPTMILWRLIVAVISRHDSVTITLLTPNPAKAPADLLGLIDVLVYADPYFAGTIGLWLLPVAVLFVLLVLWAMMGLPMLDRGRTGGTLEPNLLKVALISLAGGVVIAAPWLYALICVLQETAW